MPPKTTGMVLPRRAARHASTCVMCAHRVKRRRNAIDRTRPRGAAETREHCAWRRGAKRHGPGGTLSLPSKWSLTPQVRGSMAEKRGRACPFPSPSHTFENPTPIIIADARAIGVENPDAPSIKPLRSRAERGQDVVGVRTRATSEICGTLGGSEETSPRRPVAPIFGTPEAVRDKEREQALVAGHGCDRVPARWHSAWGGVLQARARAYRFAAERRARPAAAARGGRT